MNIAGIIDEHARKRPDSPFLLQGDRQVTYGELAAAVRHIASVLAAEGIVASAPVGVSLQKNPPLLLASILALASLGAISIPLMPRTPLARAKAIAQHFALAAILTDAEGPSVEGTRAILAKKSWLHPDAAAAPPPPRHPGGEHPWCITLTSGTTGAPKGVARTHAGFFRLSPLQVAAAGIGPDSRFLGMMDLHATAILMRAFNHLACGGAVVFPGGGEVPVDRHGVTHAFASPAAMQTWLKTRPRSRPRIETLKQLVVGGDRIPERLARAIAERITPNLFQSYGTTETGVVALCDPQTQAQHPDAAGRLFDWVEAQVVDEADRPLPEGQSGILRLRGEGIAHGYYGIAPQDAEGQRGFRDGWCYPGDMARIAAGRLLFLEGRVDDIVSMGGPKINVSAIENLLGTHPDVREASVFGVTGSSGKNYLVAAVVAGESLKSAALARYYRDRGGLHSSLLRIVRVPRLPRNATGKVLKQDLRRWIRSKAGGAA